MAFEIPISLAVEDELSEHLLRALLCAAKPNYLVATVHGKRGCDYLKRMLPAFNNGAKSHAYLLCTDLDQHLCVTALIELWFGKALAECLQWKHRNLIFLVARREIESWIMADRERFAGFLGVPLRIIPQNVDELPDPKRSLIQLAAKSPDRSVKYDLVPNSRDSRPIGPNYNGRLAGFLTNSWRPEVASRHSPSLNRAREVLNKFHPLLSAN